MSEMAEPKQRSAWTVEHKPGFAAVVSVELKKEFWVLLRSDAHWDNPDSNRNLMKKHLEQAKQRNAAVLDFGDLFCAMQGKYDRRSNKDKVRPEHQSGQYLDKLVDTAVEWHAPYAHLWAAQYQGNHECLDPETFVLTRHGFKPIAEVTKDDHVAQMHPMTREVFFGQPIKTHAYDFDGKMVHLKRRGLDMLMTPNHRVVYFSQHDEMRWRFAGELSRGGKGSPSLSIPGGGMDGVVDDHQLSDDQIRLAAWAITDGCLSGGTLAIYQSKPIMVEHIRKLLNRMGIQFTESVAIRNITHVNGVELKKPPLPQHCFRLAKASWIASGVDVTTKDFMPDWAFKLSERQFDLMLNELILGDGSRHKSAKTSMMMYGKEPFLSSLQAVCVCKNYRALLSVRKRRGDASYHCLNIVKRGSTTLKTAETIQVPYSGKVYCLTTQSGNFFARRNGSVFVTGNSSILAHHETCLLTRLAEGLRQKTGAVFPLVGYTGFVKFNFQGNKRQSCTLWGIHGYGGGGPVTKDMIQRARQQQYVDADIYVSGHTHDQFTTPDMRVGITQAGRIETRRTTYVKLPSYKDEYKQGQGGYHVEKGRPPKPVGAMWLRFWMVNSGSDKRYLRWEVREALL
jgi:hypothetical protein